MGTRNLTCLAHEGEYKVAQYCQWDGYPSGQGLNILHYLRGEFDREKLLQGLERTHIADEDEMQSILDSLGAGDGWMNLEQSRRFETEYPSLHRSTGPKVLRLIQDAADSEDVDIPLQLSVGFAKDSLFCEWAYVIDLDKNTLEVFGGFSTEPIAEEERFYSEEKPEPNAGGDVYYPVRLLRKWKLDDLPSDESFLQELEPEE